MRLRLIVIGTITLLAQTVVLRELAVAFYGVELVYAAALGAWMLGTAVGATVAGGPRAGSDAGMRALLVAFAVAVVASIAWARAMRIVLGAVAGAYLSPGRQTVGLVLCIVPVSALGGLLFQRAARVWARSGGTFAGAYAWESAGALVGGALATALAAARVANLAAGLIAAGVALVASAARRPAELGGRGRAAVSTVAVLVALVALAAGSAVDRAMTS